MANRYPGVNSFSTKDADIFCGRSTEIKKLLNRVLLNNTLVLHGDSGKGKSSLVQAGLLPELEKYNATLIKNGRLPYLAVTIKMDQITHVLATDENASNDTVLLDFTLNAVKKAAAEKDTLRPVPFLTTKENNLWYLAKQLERNGKALLLIFDQFEELQGFRPKEVRMFSEKLAELFVSAMPDELYNEYTKADVHARLQHMTDEERQAYSEELSFIEQPLCTHVLFVVREDKLGTMSLLNNSFPDILKNDFIVKSLTEENAKLAISEPCQNMGQFDSPRFEIEPDAVTELIERLKGKKKDKEDKDEEHLYDPIELQIVCRNIEKKIKVEGQKVKIGDLPEVDNAVKDFYNDTWDIIKKKHKLSDTDLTLVKKQMIKKLVVNGKRNLVMADAITKIENGKEILDDLVAEGLVRIIPSGEDDFCQLCHDRFVEPMRQDRINIRNKEEADSKLKKASLIIIGLIVLFILIEVGLYFRNYNARSREQNGKRIEAIMTNLERAGNPTLSYIIGKNWEQKNYKEVNERLDSLNAHKNAYLSGICVLANYNSIISPSSNDNTLKIIDPATTYDYNINTGVITDQDSIKRKKLMEIFPIENDQHKTLYLTRDFRNSVNIVDEKFDSIGHLQASIFLFDTKAYISSNNKYLLLDNVIYNVKTGLPIANAIPARKIRSVFESSKGNSIHTEAPARTAFLNGGKNMLAIYDDGTIDIYKMKDLGDKLLPDISSVIHGDTQSIIHADSLQTIAAAADAPFEAAFTTDIASDRLFLTLPSKLKVYDIKFLKDKSDTMVHQYLMPSLVIPLLANKITTLKVSDDDTRLITGGTKATENIVTVWDIKTFQQLAQVSTGNNEILSVTFMNSSNDLLVQTGDKKVFIWKYDYAKNLTGKMYTFSDFDYEFWGEGHDSVYYQKFRDTASWQVLYTEILHDLVSFDDAQSTIKTSQDKQLVLRMKEVVKKMFWKLMEDQKLKMQVPRANLKIIIHLANDIIFNGSQEEDAAGNNNFSHDQGLGKIEKKIAYYRTEGWKLLLLDTTMVAEKNMVYYNIKAYATYQQDSLKDYAGSIAILTFYNDSIVKPYVAKYQRPATDYPGMIIYYLLFKGYLLNNNYAGAQQVITEIQNIYQFKRLNLICKFLLQMAQKNYNEATAFYNANKEEMRYDFSSYINAKTDPDILKKVGDYISWL
jgi:WD40 repeat protein